MEGSGFGSWILWREEGGVWSTPVGRVHGWWSNQDTAPVEWESPMSDWDAAGSGGPMLDWDAAGSGGNI